MVGKFVLPLRGSAPEVWPTTVLFFQAALLAGYAFAHVTSRLPPRRQALLQLVLLGVAAVVLPIGVPDQSPPESGSPPPWLRPVYRDSSQAGTSNPGAREARLAWNAALLRWRTDFP